MQNTNANQINYTDAQRAEASAILATHYRARRVKGGLKTYLDRAQRFIQSVNGRTFHGAYALSDGIINHELNLIADATYGRGEII